MQIMWSIKHNGLWGSFAIAVYRYGHLVHEKVRCLMLRRVLMIPYLIMFALSNAATGCEIGVDCSIGKRVSFVHNANGVMIGGGATVGDNSQIYHQVTIGVINSNKKGPTIGSNCFIGAGAKILGPITIGDNVKIGANAVVLCDIPDNATAVGVPARVIC